MFSRVIRATSFVAVATVLPLVGNPALIVHPKILILMVAGLAMLLTQPDFKGHDAKTSKTTDRWSVLAILGAGIVSQVAPIIEWGYWQSDHSGNLYVTALGLGLIAGGLAFRIWSIHTLGKFFTATVQIVDGHRVIKHGPYAIVRHPSYLGAYLAIVGSGIFLNSIVGTIIGAVVMFIAYVHRLIAEEATLVAAFGEEYEEYRKATPMVVPLRFDLKN